MSGVSDRPVRTRFAPSPTGFLHVGAFRTALFSWLLARKHGGRFLLRIEDTDQNRLVPGALEHILRSLQALGIDYDEGPDVAQVAQLDATKYGTVDSGLLPADGGKYGPYFQSLRLPRYREVVDRLIEDGKAYYAFETKEELDAKRDAAAALKRAYLYDRRYREYPVGEARKRVADGEVHVVRLKMPVDGKIVAHDYLHGEMAWDASTQDDFIIQKADGFPPYHLAAMVDDHDMATSHVLRGDDWLPSFPKHSEVFRALDWEPPVFVHCPNVLGPDGKKLSKRHGARPLLGPAPEIKDGKPTGEMLDGLINDDGFLPEALVNFLALIGWSPGDDREVMSLKELLDAFSLDGIAKSGGIFDLQKLTWMNGVYLRQMTPDALGRRALPFLERAGLGVGEEDYAVAVVALEQEKIKKLSEAPALVDFCFAEKPVLEERAVQKWLRAPGAAEYLTDVAAAVETAGADAASIEAACRVVGEKHGREKGEITHPIRVALTGREAGPSLFELMAVLGKGRLRVRFAHALERARG